MEWYTKVLKDYAKFDGRARRKEYWMFFLFNILISLGLQIIEGLIYGVPVLALIYSLGVLIPGLAVSIRRLHDIGKSGWWLLIAFVPLIGGIVLLIFMVTDSTPGNNQYGPNPKGM